MEVRITINPAKIQKVLWLIASVLVLFGLIAVYLKFVRGYPTARNFIPKFYLDAEANFPTYFSSFILLTSAVLLGVIAEHKKAAQDGFYKHWLLLCFIFFFLSVDELAGIHELLGSPYADVIVEGIVVLMLIVYFFKFYRSLPKVFKVQLTLAAICYIGGAVGLEIIGGTYRRQFVHENFIYGLFTVAEESLEILGVLLFINALFKYAKGLINKVLLVLE